MCGSVDFQVHTTAVTAAACGVNQREEESVRHTLLTVQYKKKFEIGQFYKKRLAFPN